MKYPLVKILLSSLLIFCSFFGFSKEIPKKPEPAIFLNDFSGTISTQDAQYINQKLAKYSDTTSTQIVCVVENSLDGDDAFDYSMRLAQAWGIGQDKKDNGLLIYVAIQDRKMRIQVGYGLEAFVTDGESKRIIEQILKPAFKKGQYAQGLDEATTYIMGLCSGEFKPDENNGNGIPSILFILGILLIFYLISFFTRYRKVQKSHIGGPLNFMTTLMLMGEMNRQSRNSGNSSWGDFSGGGGSFGGGSFGGGGAGGDW